MSVSSRRRDLLVDGLLPLFIREVTADPEEQNLLRRKIRQQGLRDFQEDRKAERAALRAEAERRKDSKLEAKLRGPIRRHLRILKHHLIHLTELSWRRPVDRVGKPFLDTKLTIRLKGNVVPWLSMAKDTAPFLTTALDQRIAATEATEHDLLGGMARFIIWRDIDMVLIDTQAISCPRTVQVAKACLMVSPTLFQVTSLCRITAKINS